MSQETDRSFQVRVTAFVMRAVLAGSDGAASNLGLVIAESVVYSVGFFGLLYSAYTLVLDRYATPTISYSNSRAKVLVVTQGGRRRIQGSLSTLQDNVKQAPHPSRSHGRHCRWDHWIHILLHDQRG